MVLRRHKCISRKYTTSIINFAMLIPVPLSQLDMFQTRGWSKANGKLKSYLSGDTYGKAEFQESVR
jgi:hypothetical protein